MIRHVVVVSWIASMLVVPTGREASFVGPMRSIRSAVNAIGVLGLLLWVWRRRAKGLRRHGGFAAKVAAEAAAILLVARDPRRAAQLWTGALSMPVLHSAILYAVLRANGFTEFGHEHAVDRLTDGSWGDGLHWELVP